jgi:hypothetical protein
VKPEHRSFRLSNDTTETNAIIVREPDHVRYFPVMKPRLRI